MSDHVLLLEEGRLAQFAPPGDLFDCPVSQYVAEFIGTPSTNTLPATVEAGDHGPTIVGEQFEIPAPEPQFADRIGDSVTLGIRPQYLSPDEGDHRIRVIVNVVEQLGTEFVVHGTSVDGAHVNVVDENVGEAGADDELSVGFDAADAFVFDVDGETICHGDALGAARSASTSQ